MKSTLTSFLGQTSAFTQEVVLKRRYQSGREVFAKRLYFIYKAYLVKVMTKGGEVVLAVDSNPRVESTRINSTSKMSTRLDSRRLEIFISFSVISRYQIHSYISNTSPASILVYEGLPATHSGPIRGHITKVLLY